MKKPSKKEILKKIEKDTKEAMNNPDIMPHDWSHVDRVRKWALRIGHEEGSTDLFILEVTALLHDIGYTITNKENNMDHYKAGRIKAREYLKDMNYFHNNDIEKICTSIYEHGRGGPSELTKILQDADRMDLLGAIGIMRTIKHFPELPDYIDRRSFKFKIWSQPEINKKYLNFKTEIKSSLDQFNLCLSIYNTVNTKTAKKLAKEKVDFMKLYIKQLKKDTIDL